MLHHGRIAGILRQLGNGRRCDRNGTGRSHDSRALPRGQSDGLSREGLPFDLRSLRFVLAAAEQFSFSAAATALTSRVSSVSRRVRHLEDSIGVALFERSASGVLLTNAGHRFLAEVVPALRMIETALRNAGAAGRAEWGAVRVGIITTLAGGFLREAIAEFRNEFGGVRLEIHDWGAPRALQGDPRTRAGRSICY
ncbi:LysR family transcriptional regulator [Mesorhizobium sp. 1B3]|uniref:LysR family transcriptional regulator n=1 Tax=Mesorhizobium sp. 1B3 TaxID=3243599 RepID=UPI003D97B3F7